MREVGLEDELTLLPDAPPVDELVACELVVGDPEVCASDVCVPYVLHQRKRPTRLLEAIVEGSTGTSEVGAGRSDVRDTIKYAPYYYC